MDLFPKTVNSHGCMGGERRGRERWRGTRRKRGSEREKVCKSKSLLEGQKQVIEWFRLDGALKIMNFLPPSMGRETFH